MVLPASTGVIGQPLPLDRIQQAIPSLVARLHPEGLTEAAEAILTTDTFPKTSRIQGQISGQTVTLAGIAKGGGIFIRTWPRCWFFCSPMRWWRPKP